MQLVIRYDDDAPLPLVGEVVGEDGPEYVWVIWGDEDRRNSIEHGNCYAVLEARDELRPGNRNGR